MSKQGTRPGPVTVTDCPLCGKAVTGVSSLVGHLEFGHDMDDPETYVVDLFAPPKQSRWSRKKEPAPVPPEPSKQDAPAAPQPPRADVAPSAPPPSETLPEPAPPEPLAPVEALDEPLFAPVEEAPFDPDLPAIPAPVPSPPPRTSPTVTHQRTAIVEDQAPVPADGTADTPTQRRRRRLLPLAVVVVLAVGAALYTLASNDDSSPTTPVASPTDDDVAGAPGANDAAPPVDIGDFRLPFVTEARQVACRPDGPDRRRVHDLVVTFSGARDVTFDGTAYPGDAANGERPISHTVSGSAIYLDRVIVADAAGNEHEVDVSPPVYLPPC